MNGAHQHLLVNHIPVFSLLFGLVALLWTYVKPSRDMLYAAIGLFVLAGISVLIASETGESAEDLVEGIPGVTKGVIHDHEEAAEVTNIAVISLGVASLVWLLSDLYKKNFAKYVKLLVLVLAILGNALIARAAWLGGQIRHVEIRMSEEQ